jgi:hypothetical protein
MGLKTAFIFFVSILSHTAILAQSSVLHEGNWYKIAVEQPGVYKIDRNMLRRMGIDVGKLDPKQIKIFGGHRGVLPQANSALRTEDLIELAIHVQGEADGSFDNNDYILFYGEGPDRFDFDEARAIYHYERNYFTRTNYYFLQVGNEQGKRIAPANNPQTGAQTIETFDAFGFYKRDQFNMLSSGRAWFGERFDAVTSHTINFNFPDIVPNSSVKLVSSVMAQSFANSTFKIFINDIGIAQQAVLPVSNFRYALKGRIETDTITFSANTINASSNNLQRITLQYEKNNSGLSVGYLNFLLIQVKQVLKLYGNQTIFTSQQSTNQSTSTYSIGNNDSNVFIWDITDHYNIASQNFTITNQQTSFHANSDVLKSYIIFKNNNSIPAPDFINKVPHQNIRAYTTPNLLIVSHPDLLTEANRLASHRESQQINSRVVTTDEIFNEFSGGKPDVTAIRDYVRHLWLKSPNNLQNVLLFGKGTYDYLNILNRGLNLVPTYESRNSLHPLETYSSDDYFTFLEEHEGNWGESPAQNHTMDIGVGRIPAKNLNEAKAVVDKLIAYDAPNSFGAWRKEIVFVADDGDFNIHQSQANQMADYIENNFPQFNTQKIYLDAFAQETRPSGQISPATTQAITKTIERGALIINYTGHGNEQVWADERILDGFVIANLDNKQYPLFVTATCEFGRHDSPIEISAGELSLLLPNKGAIGLVTTARPVSSSTNFELNKAFYDALNTRASGNVVSMGEIFRITKNKSISGISNRNFALLGDPSMRLAIPDHGIVLSEIKTANESDTIKALSNVKVKGYIIDYKKDSLKNFNGTLNVTVFDKPTNAITLGNDNPSFAFKRFDQTIFRGQASIIEGQFDFDFTAPKNISYQTGKGKIAMYAHNRANRIDASGADNSVVVGLSEIINRTDKTPPKISLYMGDSTFVDGGYVPSTTFLLARLIDDSGINISSFGLGNTMSAQLNEETPFPVSDYFIADINNSTSGWLKYPLKDLSPGKHQITLRAWDVFNNPTTATIEFNVASKNELLIEQFRAYPNPVRAGEASSLEFIHSRSGQDMKSSLSILNNMGHEIARHEFDIINSEFRVKLADFYAGDLNTEIKKLSAGLYLFKLSLRSLADGSKNDITAKLIIIN